MAHRPRSAAAARRPSIVSMKPDFHSPYTHGFVRLAAAVPAVRVADPDHNAGATIDLARRAAREGAVLVVFPELGLSGYTLDDLVQQTALLDAVLHALERVRRASAEIDCLITVGAPLRFGDALYNCAIALHGGAILGVVPKSYLPNYREFYEKRHYSAARQAAFREVELCGQRVPFGPDLLFDAPAIDGLRVHLEVCEDVWVPVPPSTWAALAGATVLANLSASNATVGKADYRRLLCASQSARCLSAYVYSAAGHGESTTDLAWDGHALIAEDGQVLAETERFVREPRIVYADVDLERLRMDRLRMTSYQDQASDERARLSTFRRVTVPLQRPQGVRDLHRALVRFPYVPADPATRDQRCYEVYSIQVQALAQRLESAGVRRLVIGVSGGLDSTQALLVACATFDQLGLPRTDILGYTMPGFATGEETRTQAHALMRALGVSAHEIDIRPSCLAMLKDLDHPYARGEPVYDVTFENVQAGERTSHLFRLANRHGGLVLGTGDLSELALGWCTYGVGDQMSHYNVNASVPKTLIQYLIRWVAASGRVDAQASAVLLRIAEGVISPELVPADATTGRVQDTEAHVGPYELQDFHLYWVTRFGFRPSKIAFLAHQAWGDPARHRWPDLIPPERRRAYDLPTIHRWLRVFLDRFFRLSQFKRSAVPNGPKVGSGGALSPRGDWRAPSDAGSALWLAELDATVPLDER